LEREQTILTCEKCGAEIPVGTSACRECGSALTVAQIGPVYVPESAPAADLPVAGPAEPAIAPARAAYAGFWLRAVAFLIDNLILGLAFGAIAAQDPSAFFRSMDPNLLMRDPFAVLTPLAIAVMFGCTWLYGAAFESSRWQATPGKIALRLYVTDMQGQRVSFARALVRNVAKQISSIIFIGYILAGFTPKKQALHDFIASCLVMRRPARM
jgi:uncharacterized RDD family membrane protein YckC